MWLWLALALANPVDLEDPTPWVEAADRLLDGPAGCWEVAGKAVWNHRAGRYAATRGAAVFAGRLEDGVWQGFHVEPAGAIVKEFREPERRTYELDGEPFVPLLGRVKGDPEHAEHAEHAEAGVEVSVEADGRPDNVVAEVLDELRGNVEYAWTESDGDAVRLVRVVPLGKGRRAPEATVETIFHPGTVLPERTTVTFPERFTAVPVPPVVVRDGRVELRGHRVGEQVFPAAEAFSVRLGVLGIVIESAQTVTYRSFVPCGDTP